MDDDIDKEMLADIDGLDLLWMVRVIKKEKKEFCPLHEMMEM